jgi:hypothetical protein
MLSELVDVPKVPGVHCANPVGVEISFLLDDELDSSSFSITRASAILIHTSLSNVAEVVWFMHAVQKDNGHGSQLPWHIRELVFRAAAGDEKARGTLRQYGSTGGRRSASLFHAVDCRIRPSYASCFHRSHLQACFHEGTSSRVLFSRMYLALLQPPPSTGSWASPAQHCRRVC